MANGGVVSGQSGAQESPLLKQVSAVAHDLASIAHKSNMDARQVAYLLRAASGMYMPPERAFEYAKQILTGDANGLIQRFMMYKPSIRTFARLNDMMGGKVSFMGTKHMGPNMKRMKGEKSIAQTKSSVENALDSDVVKSKPVMAKALKKLNQGL